MKKIIVIMLIFVMGVSMFGCQTPQEQEVVVEDSEYISDGNVIYVNKENKNSTGDGTSWEMAFVSLQDALKIAVDGNQIWVAKGTYLPSEGDSTASFLMVDGVSLYGGFVGTETLLTERDWEINQTILSGDLGEKGDTSDNSGHVVIAANGLLDGFIISDGYGLNGMSSALSSGEVPSGAAPSVSSALVAPMGGAPEPPAGAPAPGEPGGPEIGEHPDVPPAGAEALTAPVAEPVAATQDGEMSSLGHISPSDVVQGDASSSPHGAAIIIWGSVPTIQNCTIQNNSAGKAGGIYIMNSGVSELPRLINCNIKNNFAMGRGGGVCLDMQSNAIFIDCVFDSNECNAKGGAIYNDFGCSPVLENCLFINNVAEEAGAMGNDGSSNPKINNCTFFGNEAHEIGAALYQGTGPKNDPIVTNSIVFGNICDGDSSSIYNWHETNTKIYNSIIEGGYVGDGVIADDPIFNDTKNLDFDFKASSPALTASKDGKRIGFDASVIATRTEQDYEDISAVLLAIEDTENPIPIDFTNPMSNADLTNIGEVIFVSENGEGDGSSFKSAMGSLQDAINFANAKSIKDEVNIQIWVSQGTYFAGETKSDSIILREGVSLYGGFSGTERKLAKRDYTKNKTILSGDIGTIDDASDNSYHVLVGANDCTLDGFTITGGNANKEGDSQVYDGLGGGMINYQAGNRVPPHTDPVIGFSTTVANCTFENNYAIKGGAVYTYHGSNPKYTNCTFTNNNAVYGGAVYDVCGVNSKYTDCTFENNSAHYKGGVSVVDYGAMATFSNCDFNTNEAGTSGGVIYLIDRASQATTNETDIALVDKSWPYPTDIFSTTYVKDSRFNGNKAGKSGSALYVYESSNAKIENCEFIDNQSEEGGVLGIYFLSELYIDDESVFENNTPLNIYNDDEK